MSERILLISLAFPPLPLPEAMLSAKRMGSLPGYDVDVVASEHPRQFSSRFDHSLDGYVATHFGNIVRVRFPRAWDAPPLPFLLSHLIPDPLRVVVRRATHAALRELATKRYAAVVTWSQWNSAHLVGLAVKRRHGLPWIAHFSDPWVGNPYTLRPVVVRDLDARLEAHVVRAADRLLFTSEHAAQLTMTRYPSAMQSRVRVVPHAYDPALYATTVGVGSRGDTVLLRYLGNFYGRRSPRPLTQALERLRAIDPGALRSVEIEIVGGVEPRMLDDIDPLVAVRAPVDYVTSLELMRDADGLIVIDAPADSSPFLPSKLVDYVGAGRPVAALAPAGPAADLTRRLGGPVADPRNPDACADAIRQLVQLARRRETAPFGPSGLRAAYAVATVGAQTADVVAEVADCPNAPASTP